MIDLYAAPTANGLRASIVLEECGVPYKLHPIDLAKGEHKSPDFLGRNPFGQIPVIVDNDGPGGKKVTLAQSSAIMLYIAEKTGKFMPKDPAKRATTIAALFNATADVGATLGSIFTIARSKEPHKPSQELFEGRWKGYLEAWDGILAKQKYAGCDELTVADFGLYAVLGRAKGVMPNLVSGFPNIERWMNEMAARPGTQKGMAFKQ
ncbi:MAG: glutathione S-transferase family protein [Alphaproteobacteria bacterium]